MDLTKAALLAALAALVATAPVAAQDVGINAEPQVSPDGEQVVIESATLDDDGWIVIHPQDPTERFAPDGSQVEGKRYVEAGSHTNVTVNLSTSLVLNQSLYAMLHYDDPADQTFTFLTDPGEDPPVEMVQPYNTGEQRFEGNVSVDHFFVIVGEENNQFWRKVAQREDLEKQRARKEQLKQELEEEQQQIEENQSDDETDETDETDDGTDETDGEEEEQPGFAVVGALAALVAAAALLRRR